MDFCSCIAASCLDGGCHQKVERAKEKRGKGPLSLRFVSSNLKAVVGKTSKKRTSHSHVILAKKKYLANFEPGNVGEKDCLTEVGGEGRRKWLPPPLPPPQISFSPRQSIIQREKGQEKRKKRPPTPVSPFPFPR